MLRRLASGPRILRRWNHHVVYHDPNRRDLLYHLVHGPPSLYALSFLDKKPPTPDSPAVIGWLPASNLDPATASTKFTPNPKFVSFMHTSIQSALRQDVDIMWRYAALQLQNGWLHIHDQRNPPDQGRVGDPDDIIATVLVEDSKIKPDTYSPMPSYRLCTRDGITQLTDGLADHLKQGLLDIKDS